VLFEIGKPRMHAVALLMLTLLPFTAVISMQEALAGFSDANVVLIAALYRAPLAGQPPRARRR